MFDFQIGVRSSRTVCSFIFRRMSYITVESIDDSELFVSLSRMCIIMFDLCDSKSRIYIGTGLKLRTQAADTAWLGKLPVPL